MAQVPWIVHPLGAGAAPPCLFLLQGFMLSYEQN